MTDRAFLSPATKKKIEKLEERMAGYEEQSSKLQEEIDALLISESFFKVGDVIYWTSGNKWRKGRILRVYPEYNGFTYHCALLNAKGKDIGRANVSPHHEPALEKMA